MIATGVKGGCHLCGDFHHAVDGVGVDELAGGPHGIVCL